MTVSVDIETAYCPGPSAEGYNARIDGIQFDERVVRRSVHLDDGSGCRIDIAFHRLGATVVQTASCRDDENHRYLYTGGTYRLVKGQIDERDCSP